MSGRSSAISEKLKSSPDELDVVGLVARQPQPGVRGDRRVEAPGRGGVADADPQVVDAAVGHGVLALACAPPPTLLPSGSSRKPP